MRIDRKILLLLGGGAVLGIAGTVSFDGAMKATSTQEFCLSCHEMSIPHREYQGKAHAQSRVGFTVTCGDCHIPRALIPKVERKIIAAREVWHHMLGTLDTPEKYEAHRREMAEREWARMEADDSAACRHCHDPDKMQAKPHVQQIHRQALQGGATCINCHKGIAHNLPDGM